VVILNSGAGVNNSIVLIVLVVTESLRVAADVSLDFIPISMNGFVIDIKVVHIARLNRLLLLQHGIVWVLLLALVDLDLALAELSPGPLFQLLFEVCLCIIFGLEVKLLSLLKHLLEGLIVDLIQDGIDI
jgi:hypothetical protein